MNFTVRIETVLVRASNEKIRIPVACRNVWERKRPLRKDSSRRSWLPNDNTEEDVSGKDLGNEVRRSPAIVYTIHEQTFATTVKLFSRRTTPMQLTQTECSIAAVSSFLTRSFFLSFLSFRVQLNERERERKSLNSSSAQIERFQHRWKKRERKSQR